jgi:ABC-type multidrug transport system ATPase subunit
MLGRNGAGKTTLFDLISANSHATSGEVRLLGERLLPDRIALRRRIGYLPQHLSIPDWVTGDEIITYVAKLHDIQSPREAIRDSKEYWDFGSFARKPMAACSHGMRKRVALAVATLHKPDLLILDEPFSGLDLYHIRALEQYLASRKREGKCSILSTHIIPFVAELCDRVFLLDEGKLSHLAMDEKMDYLAKIRWIESQFFGQDPTDT